MAGPSNADQPTAVDVAPLLATVRRALTARYGVDVGADAAAECARWAVENPRKLAAMTNPAGYLFRVGQTAARRLLRWHRRAIEFPREPHWDDAPDLGGDVFDALRTLSPNQRTAVLMVHGHGFTYREVADVLGVSEAAVTNHVHRGIKRLRALLEEPS